MGEETVDALEAVIAYLLSLTAVRDLVGERVAAKHEYGQLTLPDETPRGWADDDLALTLRYVGSDGEPDTASCNPVERVRLEARCWGPSTTEAARVWRLLRAVCADFVRSPVLLEDGRTALIYVLWPATDGPTADVDPDTKRDYVRGTIRVHVATTPV